MEERFFRIRIARAASEAMARVGPARRGMRAFIDSIDEDGGSPWADVERLCPWQRGEVADLGSGL